MIERNDKRMPKEMAEKLSSLTEKERKYFAVA
jgi:hypothetical protein